MMDHEPGFPAHISPREIDAIILSHAHLDHSGAIPMFHIREHTPVYGTALTFELARILISDFIHLSSYYLPYEYLDLESMMNCVIHMRYNESVEIGETQIKFLDAGHIPGSAQILINASDRRALYTGDFNTLDTRLLNGADNNYPDLDAVIIEGTYANEDHPNRETLEADFVKRVTEIVEGGGTVLVPAFAVGRSQEILCVLTAHHFEYPITIDGMALEVNEVIMRYPESLRDSKLFMNAIHTANWIGGWRDRRIATKKPGVIISPAGMLKGGAAVFYLENLAKKRENAVFLISYQIPGSPGRELLEKKQFIIGGRTRRVEASVERFDFSSHCGMKELHEAVRRLKGDPTLFVMHGAEGNCQQFAEWIKGEVGLNAVAPNAGEVHYI